VALILTALSLLFKERLQRLASRKVLEGESWRQRHVAAVTVATGAVLGALVTLSSVGGCVGVTALLFLFPLLPAARIVGSDIAHAVR